MTVTPNTTQGKGAFQVGDKVRYIGPECDGLTPGAVYYCIGVGSYNAPIHLDDDGEIRDRVGDQYELVDRVPEHPTPTQYAPELVERAFALLRTMALACPIGVKAMGDGQREAYETARSIVSDLPQEVDPDEEEAAAILEAANFKRDRDPHYVMILGVAKDALARGRQLERGDAA